MALLALLAGCAPDATREPASELVEPEVAAALLDPLMVDPSLASTDVAHDPFRAALPLDSPTGTAFPTTLTAFARRHATGRAFEGCEFGLDYSLIWVTRLPPPLALPPAARMREAAGSDTPNCRLRVVGFVSPQPPARVLADYRAIATRGRFAVSGGTDATLIATRPDGGFIARVVPDGTGSAVALMTRD